VLIATLASLVATRCWSRSVPILVDARGW